MVAAITSIAAISIRASSILFSMSGGAGNPGTTHI